MRSPNILYSKQLKRKVVSNAYSTKEERMQDLNKKIIQQERKCLILKNLHQFIKDTKNTSTRQLMELLVCLNKRRDDSFRLDPLIQEIEDELRTRLEKVPVLGFNGVFSYKKAKSSNMYKVTDLEELMENWRGKEEIKAQQFKKEYSQL